MNICVYCGSRSGRDVRFEDAARELGIAIASRGWRLVYGGGNIGLMGTVARTALENGAHVTGIIPKFLATKEIALEECTELIEVETMHIRKQLMIDRSDLLVALPGGFGTLDELFEALTWRQIRLHARPIGLLNVSGYFDPLVEMIARMQSHEFVQERHAGLLHVSDNVNNLLDVLARTTTSQFGDHLELT